MSAPSTAELRRFERLVPWYTTGKLSAEDRAFVHDYLARHPRAQVALNWHRDLGALVAARAERHALQVPEMVGWAGLESRLRAERTSTSIQVAVRRAFGARLAAAFRSLRAGLAQRPMHALAAALIVGQAVMIGALVNQSRVDTTFSDIRGAEKPSRAVLQVRFKPVAAETDLRDLLYRSGARIIDGPDQLGDYVVAPRRGSIDTLAAALGESPLVQHVNRLKHWAPEEEE